MVQELWGWIQAFFPKALVLFKDFKVTISLLPSAMMAGCSFRICIGPHSSFSGITEMISKAAVVMQKICMAFCTLPKSVSVKCRTTFLTEEALLSCSPHAHSYEYLQKKGSLKLHFVCF